MADSANCLECVFSGSFKRPDKKIACRRYPETKWTNQKGWCGEWKNKNQYIFEMAVLEDKAKEFIGSL